MTPRIVSSVGVNTPPNVPNLRRPFVGVLSTEPPMSSPTETPSGAAPSPDAVGVASEAESGATPVAVPDGSADDGSADDGSADDDSAEDDPEEDDPAGEDPVGDDSEGVDPAEPEEEASAMTGAVGGKITFIVPQHTKAASGKATSDVPAP